MSVVRNLINKANAVSTIKLRILQKYNFRKDEVHLIFEGFDDQSFYIGHLNTAPVYFTYISYGKQNSIQLYNELDWGVYNKRRILFFIDKDYDGLLGYPDPIDVNVYQTTFYSIENYLVFPDVLNRVIREIYHFDEQDEIDSILATFNTELVKFNLWIKPVVWWILIVRIKGQRPNLTDINLDEIFDMNINLQLSRRTVDKMEYLERVTQVTTPIVSFTEFKTVKTLVDGVPNAKDFVRGKFELWFFVKFLQKLELYFQANGHNPKLKTRISSGNAIEILGPRTKCPSRLAAFNGV